MRGRELVGRNIKRVRVAKGVSQEQLAFDASVDRSYLGGVERGEENPTVDILDRLATILAVPIASLFESVDASQDGVTGLKRGRKPKAK